VARYGTKLASDSPPSPEVPFLTVMRNVAGLVSRNCICPTFAFELRVMVIESSGTNAPITEKAGHSGPFSCCGIFGFEVTAIRLKNRQRFKRRKDLL
jgi:hypothetical protein